MQGIIPNSTPIATPAATPATTPAALIGPGDPAPFSIYNAPGKARVLLVVDHASNAIPAGMNQLGLDAQALSKHIAWDLGSANLARALSDLLDAPLILSGYSRLLIDPNRRLDDDTAIPVTSDGVSVPGNQGLSAAQRAQRFEAFYRPYHAAIAARLDEFAAEGICPALVSLHTCTPVMGGFARPWQIGVMWDKDPRIAQPMLAALGRMDGLCVGDNQPYSGAHPHDYTIDFHAEARGLAHVGIEVRQDLLQLPEDARHWANILAAGLAGPLADPATYRLLGSS
jgi:predicted N-formylglutamate amidohydrolase